MIESVAVRQRGAYDFETHYDNLCALQSSCPLPTVKAHLPDGVVDINGDRIRATDWVPILNSLRINKSLDFIAVRSYHEQVVESGDRTHSVRRKTPAIRSKEMTYRLGKTLKECLTVTPKLTCIELQGLPLRDRDLAVLSKGISKNFTLQHLALDYSTIGDEGLELICKGVKNNQSVISLNMSGCGLTWKGADSLAKLIRHQAMKRHNEAWQDSLRYRRPDLDRMAGIRRISINANPMLGDQGCLALADALKDDLWLKALDIQQCGVTDAGANALLDVLKFNTTIVVMDIRQNPMIDQDIIRNIMDQVMINSNGDDTEYKWIKSVPPQDPSLAKVTKKKRATRPLQNGYGKKTSIRVTPGSGNRRASRTGGSGQRQKNQIDLTSPGMPWRTALRASRYRGYPPDENSPSKHKPGVDLTPQSSPQRGIAIRVMREEDGEPVGTRGASDSELMTTSTKTMRVEIEQLRRRLEEEKAARSRAEATLLELNVENRRLRQNMEDIHARKGVLDDDQVLESIEASFKQFHAFLDLLRDAGLGQLISLAGLDDETLPFRQSESFLARNATLLQEVSKDESKDDFLPWNAGVVNGMGDGTKHAPSVYGQNNKSIPSGLPHKLITPNLQPQNYAHAGDPTMNLGAEFEASFEQQAVSKFDSFYQRALEDTNLKKLQQDRALLVNGNKTGNIDIAKPAISSSQERSLELADLTKQSDESVRSQNAANSQHSVSQSHSTSRHLESVQHLDRSNHSQFSDKSHHSQKSHHSDKSRQSEKSHHSDKSRQSEKSHHSDKSRQSEKSHHSDKSLQSEKSHHSELSVQSIRSLLSEKSLHSNNNVLPLASNEQLSSNNYSMSFEKSQSDVSDVVEDLASSGKDDSVNDDF